MKKRIYKTYIVDYHWVHASPDICVHRDTAARATRYISHNEPAGTYTRLYEHRRAWGVQDETDRAIGVASVMLQVQCISLPKRFVPSVSKCPSVVCLRSRASPFCHSLSLSLTLSKFARSLSFDLSHSLSFCSREHILEGKGGQTPPPYAHARGRRSHVN